MKVIVPVEINFLKFESFLIGALILIVAVWR